MTYLLDESILFKDVFLVEDAAQKLCDDTNIVGQTCGLKMRLST